MKANLSTQKDAADRCPIVESVKSIGNVWNFIIIRYLSDKESGFNELLRNVEGLNSKTLSRVLKGLQASGIVERTVLGTQPFSVQYALTQKGRDLKPVLDALRTWGENWAMSPEQVSGSGSTP